MPFIKEILKHKSLAIVGLEKNTGKTECLNYILKRLENTKNKIAVTSIGVDGENIDIIHKHSKPEIELYKDIIFSTSEQHYKTKKITSEILNVSNKKTALGRLITARAIDTGKVILSGPSDTIWIESWVDEMKKNKVVLSIVDGAFSRFSPASPGVTDAMILNTGATVSANLKQLVNKTKFIVDLINTDEYKTKIKNKLLSVNSGVKAIENNRIKDLQIPSILMIEKNKDKIFKYGSTIYAPGIITDKLLDFLRVQKNAKDIKLIAKDFSKLFISINSYASYLKTGAKLTVLLKPNLIMVCVNPVSNTGFRFNTKELCEKLEEALKIPVYDVKEI